MPEAIHCPRCGGTDIEVTDYEECEGGGTEYVWEGEGRRCEECGWEGHVDELEEE